MAVKKLSRYAAARRPAGDDKVVTEVSITDIVSLFLTAVKLEANKTLDAKDITTTAKIVNRLVSRIRPYYRGNKDTPADVALPMILGHNKTYRLSDLVKTVKKMAAEWRRDNPNIFSEVE